MKLIEEMWVKNKKKLQKVKSAVEAYKVPSLRRQVQKYRLEAEEVRLACQKLEETLAEERVQQIEIIEQERIRCRKDIADTVTKQHEDQLLTLKLECEKLQRTHEEALDILREENDSIREQIDQRRMEAEQARQECKNMNKLQNDYEEKLKSLTEENKRLREENSRLYGCADDDDKGIGSQNELTELRRALAEASHKCEVLIGAEEKARTLNARCEDLQLQLQRKSEYVQSIIQENKRLQEILGEEQNQKKRLSQYNEELQWRLKQTKEVMTEVVQQADLEESPAVVASRIIRRSFRNSTPPKNTPTKSPSNKRPRIRNPLSQSASSSAIIGRDKNDMNRPHSADARNGDMRTEEDDVFIWTRTPATPTDYPKTDDSPTRANIKLGAQALPTPKHLAGEAMVSESNSEDESTSSSQL
nr:unnamed protein product [Callosobruchus analis]